MNMPVRIDTSSYNGFAAAPAAPPMEEPDPILARPRVEKCSALLERASLDRIIGALAHVAERRGAAILTCAFFTATAGGVRIEATDSNLAMGATVVGGRADNNFKTALPIHKLADLLKKVDGRSDLKMDVTRTISERVGISWEGTRKVKFAQKVVDERVKLTLGRLTVTMAGEDPTVWPTVHFAPLKHSFIIPTADLLRGFGRTEMAISTEETRYYLNGTYMHVPSVGSRGTPVLRFVATDGRRMATVDVPAPAGASTAMPPAIVPLKAVCELIRLCKAKGAPEHVAVDYLAPLDEEGRPLPTYRLRFQVDNIAMVTKTIDGAFPDYQRVTPTQNDKRMVADIADMIHAIKQVTVISSERGRGVRLSLENGCLRLSVDNPDIGNAELTVSVDYAGDPLDIGFNSGYLLAILSEMKGDCVEFKLADPGSPTLIYGTDPTEKGVSYVLMPMRV